MLKLKNINIRAEVRNHSSAEIEISLVTVEASQFCFLSRKLNVHIVYVRTVHANKFLNYCLLRALNMDMRYIYYP